MIDSLSLKSEAAENFFVFISPDFLEYVFAYITYVFNAFRNQTFEKRYTRVNWKEIKISRKEYVTWTSFKVWQIKTFSESYSAMEIWLGLAYKIIKKSCFIQTQKRYPTSLDKISILNWRLLITSNENFSIELKSSKIYTLKNISYLSLRL